MVETFIQGNKYYGINEEKRLKECLKLREVEEQTGRLEEEIKKTGERGSFKNGQKATRGEKAKSLKSKIREQRA